MLAWRCAFVSRARLITKWEPGVDERGRLGLETYRYAKTTALIDGDRHGVDRRRLFKKTLA